MTPSRITTLLGLAASIAVAPTALAQAPPSLQDAQRHFQNEEWERAADVSEALVERDATNRQARLLLGASLTRLERYAEAADVYEAIAASGTAPSFVPYLAGLRNAQAGDVEAAFDWLESAVEAGHGNFSLLQSDPSFADLRADPRYSPLEERADRNARPCAYSEAHRAFDFWVGEWEVTNTAGQVAGTNSIQPAEGGCVLVERWTGATGSTGMSVNYYDPAGDRWVQQWVAPGGTLIDIEGGLNDEGEMVLVGTLTTVAGDVRPFRGTWTPLPDGRVRQHFEQSTDGGATWAPWFNGLYVPRVTTAD